MMDNYFTRLNSLNLNEHKEQKNKLDYISWAWAWAELKKLYPLSFSTVYENPSAGLPYFTDGRTCMVKVGVTCEGIEHIEWLPIMDYRNVSIPYDKVTSMDVNKAIQRATVKAIARHGIGLYVYAGEDLPEDDPALATEKKPAPAKPAPKAVAQPAELPTDKVELVKMLEGIGVDIDKVLLAYKRASFDEITADELRQAYLRKTNALNRGGAR